MERDLICINCPMGCSLHVVLDNDEVTSVTGNTCPRGKAYAISEVTHPVRMITSVLPVEGGAIAVVSCKTSQPVARERIHEGVCAMTDGRVQAPVAIGDVLVSDIAGSGADLVATKHVPCKGQ